jgi:hypothetical protein
LVPFDQSDLVDPVPSRRRYISHVTDVILSLDHYNRESTIRPDVHHERITPNNQLRAWRAAISEPLSKILVDDLTTLYQKKNQV